MKILKNKRLSIVLIVALCMQMFVFALPAMAAEGADVNQALDKTLGYYNLQEKFAPKDADWIALGLRSSGVETGNKYVSGELKEALDYGRTILGSIASNCPEATVQGYIDTLQRMQTVSEEVYAGQFGTAGATLNQTIWAVIALDFAAKNGFEVNYDRDAALNYICSQQSNNGGFGEYDSAYIDADSTAHVLVALAPEKNKYSDVIHKALVYLKSQQCDSGAFLNFGSANSDSTAAVIEALIALGENPSGAGWKGNMVEALISFQSPEGWFVYSQYNNPSQPNVMSTRNALLALVDVVNGQSKYQRPLPDTNGLSLTVKAQDIFRLDSDARLSCSLLNSGSQKASILVLTGLYNKTNEHMLTYTSMEKILQAGENVELGCGFTIPAAGEYEVRTFVWD
ncbi:MAG: terpene cyclase/mutase family protein, partial [Syntrophomonadaceae bacterium]|nr:terpene cyclase/mutase family protein [Syntrophomonadaceae bacterium]